MNCIDSWCPLCVRRTCISVCKFFGLKKNKSYKGARQFYEDQTETKRITDLEKDSLHNNEHKHAHKQDAGTSHHRHGQIPPGDPIKPPKTSIKITEQELFDNIGKDMLLPTQTKPIEERREVVVEDLLNNNSNIEYQSKTPSPKKEMEDIQIAPIIETSSFRINLEPYEKYYGLLEDKSRNLKEKINLAGTVVQVEKVGNTELQIRHSQPEKLNIFVYSFKLPCTYSFYNGMLNDYTLQKKLDNNIDEYKMLELVTNNARVNYLSYKKVLIVSPRDFVYMKYSNSWENEYWDLSFSVPHEIFPNKVRGEIILSACKIIEKENSIYVQVYSQVDMKLTVNPKITKNQAIVQIRKYVEKCQQYVRLNYQKEMV